MRPGDGGWSDAVPTIHPAAGLVAAMVSALPVRQSRDRPARPPRGRRRGDHCGALVPAEARSRCLLDSGKHVIALWNAMKDAGFRVARAW
jgi:hypothetical protein